jgi:hypothetical protein
MDAWPHRYDLDAEGSPKAEAGAVAEIPVRLMAEESRLESRSTPDMFVLIAADDDRLSFREEDRFLSGLSASMGRSTPHKRARPPSTDMPMPSVFRRCGMRFSIDEPWKVEDRGEKPAIALKGR